MSSFSFFFFLFFILFRKPFYFESRCSQLWSVVKISIHNVNRYFILCYFLAGCFISKVVDNIINKTNCSINIRWL